MKVPLILLRCPLTGQPLEMTADSRLVTEDGLHEYPVVDGVPVLLAAETSTVFEAERIARSAGAVPAAGRARMLARRLTPSTSLNLGTHERFARFADLVGSAGRRPARVLVVGGGEVGQGMEPLLRGTDIELLETDVYLGPRVSVVCDGHALPFADATFDGVVAQAVLEHVLDPVRVVSELHRVLAPAGLVYAETPFMQQVHEGAYDFSRFTDLGHRRLFRMFDEVDRGVAVGPATALLWSARYFARSLPARSPTAALILDKLVSLALFWLKYADRALVSHAGATDAASGLYFLGRRAEQPIPDSEIVASYRGTVGSVGTARGNVD